MGGIMYKVLIVEDEPGIREEVAAQLQSWGMDTHIVTDFRKVTADFAEYEPHLVLLDISLPFMNGYHWCKEIRATCRPRRIT